ncbi:hypothetical protein AAG906_013389 [Vitis piasezkii]
MNSRLFIPPPIYLFLFFLRFLAVHVSGYEPSYNVTLNCGSPDVTTALDSRLWQGDEQSNFTSASKQLQNASFISEASQQAPSIDRTPYMTARIFRSPFTYVFDPVPPGPKFIRLHFYPVLYGEFDGSKTFFSVTVSTYTFLSNFSASLTAQSLGLKAFSKEFSINLAEDQLLNITFIPSSETSDGYAFINGIEIVSMPEYLYYSGSNDIGLPIIGQSSSMTIDKAFALETVYRLNVGGQNISPMKDTGMFRTWSDDIEYLGYRGADPVNTSNPIQYSDKFPNYSAPELVYQTARTMGQFKSLNIQINLTWTLPVYLGFNYLIRLHFCEFSSLITNKQDREFHIFINQQTAETEADAITWSGGNGRAVFRDYVVILQNGSQGMHKLYIDLHPNADARTAYSDAILNGLELFKLSSASGNLAGPNPEPKATTIFAPTKPSSHPTESLEKSKRSTIAIAGSVLGAVFLLSMLGVFVLRTRKAAKEISHGYQTSTCTTLSNTTTSTKTKASSLPSGLCRRFTLSEIKKATNNFDIILRIGVGGFGNVYKGYIDDKATPVAIKRLNPQSKQGAREFLTEIEMLSMLRHIHLVSLIGFCSEDHEMILVYDYMANGSFCDHLYGTNNPPLPWKQRLQICLGAARGLHYLHTGATHMIIHRDVKTTNILLDEKWVAKVSDFGLSKAGSTSMSRNHVSTVVKGTLGYLDPEYFRLQQLTEKSDVYSFGVVLFEVLCARPPVIKSEDNDRVSLGVWGPCCFQEGTLDQIVDPHLKGDIAPECLNKFGEIAVSCLLRDGIERPSMSDVVWGLEFALQLQETAEQVGMDGGHLSEEKDAEPLLCYSNTDRVDDAFDESSGQVSGSRSSVFTTASSHSDNVGVGVFSLVRSHSGR